MAVTRLRLKLDFGSKKPLIWTFCDLKKVKTIQDLCQEIERKHKFKNVSLELENAFLPPNEPIVILENGDTLKICQKIQIENSSSDESSVKSLKITEKPKINGKKPKFSKEDSSTSSESSDNDENEAYERVKEIYENRQKHDKMAKNDHKNSSNQSSTSSDSSSNEDSDSNLREQPFKKHQKLEVKGNFVKSPIKENFVKSPSKDNLENGEPTKKKRKRRKKNKNKNKLPQNEFITNDFNIPPTTIPKAEIPKELPSHGKRTIFNSDDEEMEEISSNGHKNVEISEGALTSSLDQSQSKENFSELDSSTKDTPKPLKKIAVSKEIKKLAPNQNSISCEDILLQSEPPPKRKVENGANFQNGTPNGLSALLSLKDNPLKAKRMAKKDVFSAKSVILTNPTTKNFDIENINSHPELQDDPKAGQTLAFKCLQIGPDYTPQLTQYIGEIVEFDENSKVAKILVIYDENDGKDRLDKFEIDNVIDGATLKNREVEFSWSTLNDVRLVSDGAN